MSAFWIQFVTILCLYGACAGKAEPGIVINTIKKHYGVLKHERVFCFVEIGGVVRKRAGEDITIQCKCGKSPMYLYLKKGLHKENDVFFKAMGSNNHTVASGLTGRLQIHGAFPNIDILIKNLTLQDTGPYWCQYFVFSTSTFQLESVPSNGSLLLVVTGESHQFL